MLKVLVKSNDILECLVQRRNRRDPFWSVFQEYSLDSTGLDCSMTLFIIQIVPLYYLVLWNQVDALQHHFRRNRVRCASGRDLTVSSILSFKRRLSNKINTYGTFKSSSPLLQIIVGVLKWNILAQFSFSGQLVMSN